MLYSHLVVYRIAGVYRRRIDELRPMFQDAELVEAADDTILRIKPTAPGEPGAEVQATPAGFYIHWWSASDPFAEDQAERDKLFAKLATWTAELADTHLYADFNRKTGQLTVGRYRLFPYAADADLSARVIREGLSEVAELRRRVEALVREKLRD